LNKRPPSFQSAQLPPDFTARKPLVFSIKSGVSLLSNLAPPQGAVLVLQISVNCLIEFSSRQIEVTDGPSRKTKNWGRMKKTVHFQPRCLSSRKRYPRQWAQRLRSRGRRVIKGNTCPSIILRYTAPIVTRVTIG